MSSVNSCAASTPETALSSRSLGVKRDEDGSYRIGPIASPDVIPWAPALPKNRAGKILRRILTKVAANDFENFGDTSTVADPAIIGDIVQSRKDTLEKEPT